MSSKPKYKSDASEAIHSTVTGMYEAGIVDKETMRSFDESCLTVPDSIELAQIKLIRENQQVSEPVFARYLNTSKSIVEK